MNRLPVARADSSSAPPELVREHMAMLRLLGSLQQRMDDVGRLHHGQVRQLQAENLRLRAELVLLRTSVYWGLGLNTVMRRSAPARPFETPHCAADAPEAQAVICQTGCVGHAHPWLDAEGQCRRSGQACERMVTGETR